MLSRYLGNKSTLLTPILDQIARHTPQGGRVGDLFGGTMVVALALKEAGYDVVTNDVNLFSTMTARAFIANNQLPEVALEALLGEAPARRAMAGVAAELASLTGAEGFRFLADAHQAARYGRLLALLRALERLEDNHPDAPATPFFDHYCEAGPRSAFVSSRGRRGNRRFFTPDNARRIDRVTSHLRAWRQQGALDDTLLAVLCSATVRGVEKISNTQGTYHDFPREGYDPRALKPLCFEPPPFDAALVGGDHLVGDAEDSLEFARRTPPLDTLYLDPPYNFRQYTAYYFLPNVLCAYPDMDDPQGYFSQVRHVRGQNMDDDFSSPFCSKHRFLDALQTLIERAQARTVVLSYFNGRNHWGDFKQAADDATLGPLRGFFEGALFEPGSLEILPLARTNYQSYGGHNAKVVSELLITARTRPANDSTNH